MPAGAGAPAQPEALSGGELTRMVRRLELGDADAALARKRERVTKAYDSMIVRLEMGCDEEGHPPLPTGLQELRKIAFLAPRHAICQPAQRARAHAAQGVELRQARAQQLG